MGELRDVEQRTMRLAQQGYSHHGIAKKYLDRIEEEHGREALW